MPVLSSSVSPSSEAFRTNAEKMRALVAGIAGKAETIQRGGSEEARKRHISRGKLLPRERLAQLLDTGSPFLEIGQFAAWDMYDDAISAAGMIAGIGRVEDLQWYTARGAKGIVCGRFIDGEGRHLVGPLDKRMIGITPDELRACSGILVAAGREKVTAIRAALAGGLVSHLVVDLEIGSLLLAT